MTYAPERLNSGEVTPPDFSDEEDDPRVNALNKQALLEWLTEADFTQEMSLTKLAGHKFRLDQEELDAMIGTEGLMKICRVMLYKIGLTYKRMDIYFNDLRNEFKENTALTLGGLRKDLLQVNEVIGQVHDEME